LFTSPAVRSIERAGALLSLLLGLGDDVRIALAAAVARRNALSRSIGRSRGKGGSGNGRIADTDPGSNESRVTGGGWGLV